MGRRVRKSRSALKAWKQMVVSTKLLNLAFTNIGIYPATHPEVRDVVRRLHEVLAEIFAEHEDMGYGYMDEILYIEGAPSVEETLANETLIASFKKLRLKYLTIDKAATPEHILAFFVAMNEELAKQSGKPLSELLHAKEVETLHIVEADPEDMAGQGKKGKRKTLLDWYEKVVNMLKPLHDQLRDSPKADLRPLYRTADDMMATLRTKGCDPFLLLPLLSKNFDPHMAHSLNVAIYCGGLAELFGLNSGQAQTLVVGALLHDLGRCIIPTDWAKDPSPLTLFERAVVTQHSSWGFLLLTRNEEIPPHVGLLAGRHHEKPTAESADNGLSYFPDILHKILHLADHYDLAQNSDRFYWKKQRPDRMLRRILNRRGSWYDPTLVKLLVQLVGLYPVGTLVELDDGRRGIVVRSDPLNAARPRVYLFEEEPPAPKPEAAALRVSPEEPLEPAPVICDLMELAKDGLSFPRSIRRILGSAPGVDIPALIDKKKEHLLSHAL